MKQSVRLKHIEVKCVFESMDTLTDAGAAAHAGEAAPFEQRYYVE